MCRLPKKIVDVYLPRLNIQIMHEWTTPADKQIVEITDDEEKRKNQHKHDAIFIMSINFLYNMNYLILYS
jgi:hypothetical protein